MKTKIYKISGLLIMAFLLGACKKDFLNIVPKGKVIATTLKDYDLLMNNSSFYDINADNSYLVMGDDMAAEQSLFQNTSAINQRLFAWNDRILDPGQTDIYTGAQLTNLFICNKIISEVTAISDGTAQQRASLQAEALATRAWINFDLINRYAKPYDQHTASSDPGFPIITSADINAGGYKRSSVSEFYQTIITDLQQAIPALPVKNVFVTRMSRTAAKALLGKVYLFMGRYQDALTQFNGAFDDLASTPTSASLYNYNDAFAPGGAFLPIGRFGPDYPGSNKFKYQESILLKTLRVFPSYNGLVMTPAVMALYGSSDLRLNFYSGMHPDFTPVPGGLKVKYAIQFSHVGVELSDLILMRAEVKARLNDLPGARTDLEWLRSNRMPGPDAAVPIAVATQNSLIRFVIDERQREFASEGQRWLDMRRLSVDPLFASQASIHNVYGPDGMTISDTFNLRPVRLTLKLPENILQLNPGITDNP